MPVIEDWASQLQLQIILEVLSPAKTVEASLGGTSSGLLSVMEALGKQRLKARHRVPGPPPAFTVVLHCDRTTLCALGCSSSLAAEKQAFPMHYVILRKRLPMCSITRLAHSCSRFVPTTF